MWKDMQMYRPETELREYNVFAWLMTGIHLEAFVKTVMNTQKS
jgi:hypothetical protein